MSKRVWFKTGGMSAESDDGRRVARGHRFFMGYWRDGRGLSIPVENGYEDGLEEASRFYAALDLRHEPKWWSGGALTPEELCEMKEDLTDALALDGTKAIFVAS